MRYHPSPAWKLLFPLRALFWPGLVGAHLPPRPPNKEGLMADISTDPDASECDGCELCEPVPSGAEVDGCPGCPLCRESLSEPDEEADR